MVNCFFYASIFCSHGSYNLICMRHDQDNLGSFRGNIRELLDYAGGRGTVFDERMIIIDISIAFVLDA
jgi:hypothetical protein